MQREAATPRVAVTQSRSPVLKALQLLAHVAEAGVPIPLADLSRVTGFPKATVVRLAALLEKAQLLRRDALTRRYEIGSTLEALAFKAIRHGPATRARHLHMTRLAEKVGERINIGVLAGGQVAYVEWVESAWPLKVDFKPGAQVPVHCTANGKLLLAYAPPAVRDSVLAGAPFRAYTPRTITSAEALKRELDRVRQLGYAEDDEEYLAGVCCLAVPVTDAGGEVIAGLAVMAPSARLPLERARTYLPDLRACAAAVGADLHSAAPGNARPPQGPSTGKDRNPPRTTRHRRGG